MQNKTLKCFIIDSDSKLSCINIDRKNVSTAGGNSPALFKATKAALKIIRKQTTCSYSPIQESSSSPRQYLWFWFGPLIHIRVSSFVA